MTGSTASSCSVYVIQLEVLQSSQRGTISVKPSSRDTEALSRTRVQDTDRKLLSIVTEEDLDRVMKLTVVRYDLLIRLNAKNVSIKTSERKVSGEGLFTWCGQHK